MATKFALVGAGGIGSMRRGIRSWKNLRRKRERLSVDCGPTLSLFRRGNGGTEASERRVADFFNLLLGTKRSRHKEMYPGLKRSGRSNELK